MALAQLAEPGAQRVRGFAASQAPGTAPCAGTSQPHLCVTSLSFHYKRWDCKGACGELINPPKAVTHSDLFLCATSFCHSQSVMDVTNLSLERLGIFFLSVLQTALSLEENVRILLTWTCQASPGIFCCLSIAFVWALVRQGNDWTTCHVYKIKSTLLFSHRSLNRD